MITKFFVFREKENEWECVRVLEDNLNLTKTDTIEFEGKDYRMDCRAYNIETNVLQIHLVVK